MTVTAMIPEIFAVVAGEDDQRLVVEVEPAQRIEEPSPRRRARGSEPQPRVYRQPWQDSRCGRKSQHKKPNRKFQIPQAKQTEEFPPGRSGRRGLSPQQLFESVASFPPPGLDIRRRRKRPDKIQGKRRLRLQKSKPTTGKNQFPAKKPRRPPPRGRLPLKRPMEEGRAEGAIQGSIRSATK